MNKSTIVLVIWLTLTGCMRNTNVIPEITDVFHLEQTEINSNQIQTEVHLVVERYLPKFEISRESIFSEFPESPDYFIESNIDVTIERIDERTSQVPTYFGIEPVFVNGENFRIIYTTDNGYEISLISLKGKSIFTYWNQYFDATWNDVVEAWGEPETGGRCYYDNTQWYFIEFFSIDKITGKIEEIRIGRSL